uniref:CCHC-type domain-containing protein n=1 Tax=Fagus sylvatica TaxID=28930 RepID=A0A2N9F1W8_FAGSY
MVEEEKEKRSLNLLSVISKTIDRQVLGLATTIAWYNHHRAIVFPKDNLFEVTVGGLRYTGDLERLEDCYNKEENLSDVPSAVKDFVEKNDTTGGGSFSENSESIGNNCLNSDQEDEEQTLNFGSIGKEDVTWGKQISGKSKGKEVSGKLDVQPVQKFSGPRIRLTARKRVPNQFEKYTFSIPAHSGSPSQDKATSSPIRVPDPRGKQAQSIFPARVVTQPNLHDDPSKRCDPRLDPVRVTRDPRAQAQALQACDPRALNDPTRGSRDPRVLLQHPICGSTCGPLDPIHPYSNWVWTRNPNLGFSSPSEVRFGPFKHRYDQYIEEHYSRGYPNPHFRNKRKKWDEDDALAKASMLHYMKDNIIPLFEERPTAKEMMDALETKYGCRSDTQIQLLLDKFNNIKMNEGDVVGDHVNELELIAKELADAGHTLSDKMQITVVLNSLPSSWDHVVTSLTHSGKELAMITLPVLLMLKEDRIKRMKRDNTSSSLMMAHSSHANQFKPKNKFKHKRFKKQWTKKPRQEFKRRDVCYRCDEKGHYKINCPLNKKPKNKGKEIAMTIIEALVIESPPTSWWVDSAATRHIVRNRELFVDLREKQLGEHRVYMGNNTYSDVLGEGRFKFSIGDFVIVLNNVLYVPSVCRNLIIVPVLDEKGFEVKMKSGRVFISKGDISVSGVKLMKSHDAEQWLKAMHEELDSISKNEVWDLTELPTGRKPVGCKWVLRKKYKADGSLDKYKARLVAKGFTQQPGMDFVDTYSPVAKFASVRIIMVVASRLDLELHQLDAILDIGYEMNPLDHCVYVWRDKEKLALLSIYVDDILLASNSPDMMKETKFCLGSKFEMKDMGPANYVLGIRISRDRDSKLIYLDQENYLKKVLKRFKMKDCRPVSTPVSKGMILNKSMCPTNKIELEEMKAVPYAQAVGSLMYAMTSTRLDICYTVGLLCFGLDELEIKGFTDADFAGDTDGRKSTSGYVFLFGGIAVSWLSKKQGCVAKYTMEAEYITCSTAVSNAVWIKRFVDSLKLDMQDRPVNVFCDNKSAISLITSGANSSKGKHIDVNYHYIQDIVERGEIKVHFVPSADMMADPMTKGLTLNQFRVHVTGMGLRGNSVELHSFARSDGPRNA